MALDRESIVRRQFPTHRRGYDPEAVRAHLEALADEVDALRERAAEPATLSSQAGEQVRAIVQAAERGAAEIRESASAEARDHVAHVTEAAARLRGRIEQMEADIARVLQTFRTDAERLHADLRALQEGTTALRGAEAERPAPAEHPAAAAEPPSEVTPAAAEAPTEVAPPAERAAADDATAARIVALDMALSGTPREETARFLEEHYEVEDREALLDEVYSAAAS